MILTLPTNQNLMLIHTANLGGIELDSKLTFRPYVDFLAKKLSISIDIFKIIFYTPL